MALTLYDLSVVSYLQTLAGVAGFLDRGLAFCQDNNIDPQAFVETRFAPDMHPLEFQVQSVAHHSLGAMLGAQAGEFSPPPPIPAQDYAGLQAMVAEARAGLQGIAPQTINALEGRDMVFRLGARDMPFLVEDFVMSFSLPNFYFHATTAYDILRSKGVPLGKRDYLGRTRMKT
jgi:hypothetical protein